MQKELARDLLQAGRALSFPSLRGSPGSQVAEEQDRLQGWGSSGSRDLQRRLEQPRIGQLAMYEAGEGTRTRYTPDMAAFELTSDLSQQLFFKKKNPGHA